MSRVLDYLLSGGRFRRGIAAPLHAVVWTRRLVGGRSDVPEMRLLDGLCLRGRVALDVGAHSGNWTVNLAHRVGDTGKVVAYEALPHYGRALSLALKLMRVQNAAVRVVAVGDRERTISLRWRSEKNELLTGRTHIEPGSEISDGVLRIPMVSLDHDLASLGIALTEVAFVKIDVEGAELEVLRGAAQLLATGRPVVYLETEPEWAARLGHSVHEVFSDMSDHGYRPYLLSGGKRTPTDVEAYLAQYTAERTYNNVLFVHSSITAM